MREYTGLMCVYTREFSTRTFRMHYIFKHVSSIAHERQNVDDGRTMIYINIQRHCATELASMGLAQAFSTQEIQQWSSIPPKAYRYSSGHRKVPVSFPFNMHAVHYGFPYCSSKYCVITLLKRKRNGTRACDSPER